MTQQVANDEWVVGLRPPPEEELVRELRDFLRRGLGKAFGARADVDDADLDDLAQDAVLRVLDRLDSFQGASRFTTWAMSVAIRVALSALRRRHAPPAPLEEIVEPAAQADPAGGLQRAEVFAVLRRSIDEALTPRQRQAILGKLAGLPTLVIADKLEMKLNAFYKLDHDARRKLRRAIEAAGFTRADVRAALDPMEAA